LAILDFVSVPISEQDFFKKFGRFLFQISFVFHKFSFAFFTFHLEKLKKINEPIKIWSQENSLFSPNLWREFF